MIYYRFYYYNAFKEDDLIDRNLITCYYWFPTPTKSTLSSICIYYGLPHI
ncbi:hypothetical protein F383_21443 [Gossypium arboreum]|uniref:Uncharacterized protein n=1 Tax=Gossypium arboreum TaxID=29729 RepID=A0A0B0NRU9_GOSAR|nr:hypothetical protein F383_21443 [Gossypium arboreum]